MRSVAQTKRKWVDASRTLASKPVRHKVPSNYHPQERLRRCMISLYLNAIPERFTFRHKNRVTWVKLLLVLNEKFMRLTTWQIHPLEFDAKLVHRQWVNCQSASTILRLLKASTEKKRLKTTAFLPRSFKNPTKVNRKHYESIHTSQLQRQVMQHYWKPRWMICIAERVKGFLYLRRIACSIRHTYYGAKV